MNAHPHHPAAPGRPHLARPDLAHARRGQLPLALVVALVALVASLLAPTAAPAYTESDEEIPESVRAQGEEAVLEYVNRQNEQSLKLRDRVAQERGERREKLKADIVAGNRALLESRRVEAMQAERARAEREETQAAQTRTTWLATLLAGGLIAGFYYAVRALVAERGAVRTAVAPPLALLPEDRRAAGLDTARPTPPQPAPRGTTTASRHVAAPGEVPNWIRNAGRPPTGGGD